MNGSLAPRVTCSKGEIEGGEVEHFIDAYFFAYVGVFAWLCMFNGYYDISCIQARHEMSTVIPN